MAKLRLGVALLLPAPTGQEVDGLRRAVGDRSLGRAPAHLTLMPPVNVRSDDLGEALALLRAAAATTPRRLDLTLGAPTTFLPDNPVLYLPVSGNVDALHDLRNLLLAPPMARTPAWPFVPHVTLADEAPLDRLAAAVAALADYRADVAIERVHLMVEVRGAGLGWPRWHPLADVVFGPPSVVARAGPLAVELVRSQMLDPEGAALVRAEGIDLNGCLPPPALPAAVSPGAVPTEVPPRALAAGRVAVVWPAGDRTLVVTARREGDVVGVAGAWSSPDGCRSAVLVATAHRGQGLGPHLDAALAHAVSDAGWGCSQLQPASALDYSKRTAE